jgi:hypothetical protein
MEAEGIVCLIDGIGNRSFIRWMAFRCSASILRLLFTNVHTYLTTDSESSRFLSKKGFLALILDL